MANAEVRWRHRFDNFERTLQMLARHAAVDAAVVSGSRALGCHRPGSDLDLPLLGDPLSAHILGRIDEYSMICSFPG